MCACVREGERGGAGKKHLSDQISEQILKDLHLHKIHMIYI